MDKPRAFDVCVIGSGAAGGVLAKELAESGAKVGLVEAGRLMTAKDFHYHSWPYEYPFRGTMRARPEPFYPPEVRQSISYQNCDDVFIDRIRALGGRTIHWNAVCLRFSERDFERRRMREWRKTGPSATRTLRPTTHMSRR
jgi:choline dehydrogenase-like flavoprotein